MVHTFEVQELFKWHNEN